MIILAVFVLLAGGIAYDETVLMCMVCEPYSLLRLAEGA